VDDDRWNGKLEEAVGAGIAVPVAIGGLERGRLERGRLERGGIERGGAEKACESAAV
jgi:hypothetical protein